MRTPEEHRREVDEAIAQCNRLIDQSLENLRASRVRAERNMRWTWIFVAAFVLLAVVASAVKVALQ
jgi:hypothetical protein